MLIYVLYHNLVRSYWFCAQDKLDALPQGSKLALRDLSLTFPVGLADTCRQAFQVSVSEYVSQRFLDSKRIFTLFSTDMSKSR